MRAAVQGILNSWMGERVQMKKELFAGMELFLGRKQLLCIGAGLILGIMGQVSQAMNSSQDSLERPGIGQEETRELLVEGLMEEEALPVEIDLSPRQYREEEALRVYEDILEELPGRILGENTSLMESQENVWTSTNFLSTYMLSLTGLELTPYNEYLLDLQEEIPALNHLGYMDSAGKWHRWENADNRTLELEREYECLQYNELMDSNNRVDEFFRIKAEDGNSG
mgnify:CR=1 FL=1